MIIILLIPCNTQIIYIQAVTMSHFFHKIEGTQLNKFFLELILMIENEILKKNNLSTKICFKVLLFRPCAKSKNEHQNF